MNSNRFTDQHKRLIDFQDEVWVHCPLCNKQTVARLWAQEKKVRLTCVHCSYHKVVSTLMPDTKGRFIELKQAAHNYFGAELWFSHQFKNDIFWVYNPEHLEYLEYYITAKIREHKNREHFSLLEKLPRFYHESKNREGLLKLIDKLKNK